MRVPDKVTVRVVAPEDSDLSNIIVELIVTTGRKSPYRVYFPKTDASGVALLTRDDFLGQFTDQWEGGLMDYAGTIGSAQPLVQVGLYDPTWSIANRESALAWPLLKHERTKWSTREEQYRYRTTTQNGDFETSPIAVDLEKTTEIILPLRRKRRVP